MNLCNEAKIRCDAEVFGLFRDLIPAVLTAEGGELQYGRQRVGLTPDFLLRIPTPDGVQDYLGEIKCMSTGVSRYPPGRPEKQADRRARELPATYRRPLERLDRQYRGDRSSGGSSAEIWRAAVLRGGGLGRWVKTSPLAHSDLRREPGGVSVPRHWPSRTARSAECAGRSVQAAHQYMRGTGQRSVSHIAGWGNFSSS